MESPELVAKKFPIRCSASFGWDYVKLKDVRRCLLLILFTRDSVDRVSSQSSLKLNEREQKKVSEIIQKAGAGHGLG